MTQFNFTQAEQVAQNVIAVLKAVDEPELFTTLFTDDEDGNKAYASNGYWGSSYTFNLPNPEELEDYEWDEEKSYNDAYQACLDDFIQTGGNLLDYDEMGNDEGTIRKLVIDEIKKVYDYDEYGANISMAEEAYIWEEVGEWMFKSNAGI